VGKHQLAVLMPGSNCRASDGQWHGNDAVAGDIGTREELNDVCACGNVVSHSRRGFSRTIGLRQMRENFTREVLKVERDSLWRIQAGSCGVDARSTHLATLDALAQGNCVLGVGSGVNYGCETGVRKHLLQMHCELVGRLTGYIQPFRLGEMNVRVPETCKDDTIVARHPRRAWRNANVLANSGNLSCVKKDRRTAGRLSIRRPINFGARNRQVLGLSAADKTDPTKIPLAVSVS
jgi:hypothetical protein